MLMFTGELIARGALLCVITAFTLLMLRRVAAAYRHLICVVGLAAILLLPVAQRAIPPLALLSANSTGAVTSTAPAEAVPSVRIAASKSADPSVSSTRDQAIKDVLFPAREPGKLSAIKIQPPTRANSHLPAILILWAVGSVVLCIRLLVAIIRLQRIGRGSRLANVGGIPVFASDTAETPLTWGLRKPIIVLPAALLSGNNVVAECAVLHEQAHILRRDWAWNLFAELVCALCWFQPGVWWLRSKMRMEAELACDDAVLLTGISGPDYADHLVQILRAVNKCDPAPAMALHGTLSNRMNHILSNAPRRKTHAGGMLAFAICTTCLLLSTALRLSARPVNPGKSAISDPAVPDFMPAAESPGINHREVHAISGLRAGGASPFQDDPLSERALPGKVDWCEPMDGLQAGIMFAQSAASGPRTLPVNSAIEFSVLIRNTSTRVQMFEAQCWNADGLDIPYLIPGSQLNNAFTAPDGLKPYRADSWPYSALGLIPSYSLKLNPGETVVIPGSFGLYVGAAKQNKYPQISKASAGVYWVVQPVRIQKMSREDYVKLASSSPIAVTIFNSNGKSTPGVARCLPATSAGKPVYVKSSVTVLSEAGSPSSPAGEVLWGKPDKGLQCGMRVLTNGTNFKTGDTVKAEVLWRNVTTHAIHTPRPTKLDLQSFIMDRDGNYLPVDQGPRVLILPSWVNVKSGEIVTLGTFEVVLAPRTSGGADKSYNTGYIMLQPGRYRLLASGGVSAIGGGSPLSGGFGFTFYSETDYGKPGDRPIAWGQQKNGIRLGLRTPADGNVFASFTQIRFDVFVNNQTTHAQQIHWLQPSRMEYLSPDLFTAKGDPIRFEHLIAGPYIEQTINLEAGQTALLGAIRLPDRVAETFDALPRGPYSTGSAPPTVNYRAVFNMEFRVGPSQASTLKSELKFGFLRK